MSLVLYCLVSKRSINTQKRARIYLIVIGFFHLFYNTFQFFLKFLFFLLINIAFFIHFIFLFNFNLHEFNCFGNLNVTNAYTANNREAGEKEGEGGRERWPRWGWIPAPCRVLSGRIHRNPFVACCGFWAIIGTRGCCQRGRLSNGPNTDRVRAYLPRTSGFLECVGLI